MRFNNSVMPANCNPSLARYCSHVVTDEINSVVEALLLDLVRFQDRQHQKDPVKAKSKRRYVCGLREVHKHIEVGKIKCVIVPPNLDHIQSTGTKPLVIIIAIIIASVQIRGFHCNMYM